MKKFSILFLLPISNIGKFHLSWLKYICCTVLALSACFGGKTQMHFTFGQLPDFSAVSTAGIETGFRITDLNISSNLAKGFEFQVTINTKELKPNKLYNIFAVGFYKPSANNPATGEFCTVIRLLLNDEILYVYRTIDQSGDALLPLKLWNPKMVPDDDGVGIRTIRFNIDSFSTKIYSYDPMSAHLNDQVCELSFWGLLGSQAKRIFENPCWPGAHPAVLLPTDQDQFLNADLNPFHRINISPAASDPVTGGTPNTPQSRMAVQKETCSSCQVDNLSLPQKKNITYTTRSIVHVPKMPMYLRTTAVVAEDKKENSNISLFKWTIYPNPTTDKITLEINSPDNLEAAIELTDRQGRKVYTSNINIVKGINRQTISLRGLSLSAGIYLIRMRPVASEIITEKEQTRKIILQY